MHLQPPPWKPLPEIPPKRCVVEKKLKPQKRLIIPWTYATWISRIFQVTPSHRKTRIYTFSATFRDQGLLLVDWYIKILAWHTIGLRTRIKWLPCVNSFWRFPTLNDKTNFLNWRLFIYGSSNSWKIAAWFVDLRPWVKYGLELMVSDSYLILIRNSVTKSPIYLIQNV
jgi:hypothetical protein